MRLKHLSVLLPPPTSLLPLFPAHPHQMPVMDGLEATREIRKTVPAAMQPWVVACTAHTMKEEVERALQSGYGTLMRKFETGWRACKTFGVRERIVSVGGSSPDSPAPLNTRTTFLTTPPSPFPPLPRFFLGWTGS